MGTKWGGKHEAGGKNNVKEIQPGVAVHTSPSSTRDVEAERQELGWSKV